MFGRAIGYRVARSRSPFLSLYDGHLVRRRWGRLASSRNVRGVSLAGGGGIESSSTSPRRTGSSYQALVAFFGSSCQALFAFRARHFSLFDPKDAILPESRIPRRPRILPNPLLGDWCQALPSLTGRTGCYRRWTWPVSEVAWRASRDRGRDRSRSTTGLRVRGQRGPRWRTRRATVSHAR